MSTPKFAYRLVRAALLTLVAIIVGAVTLAIAPPARSGVDETGAYVTTVPIKVPSFRGLEPRIALTYSSRAGNGIAGVGWRVDASSYIVRSGVGGGAPRYDDADRFLLDGNELVPCEYRFSHELPDGGSWLRLIRGGEASCNDGRRIPSDFADPRGTHSTKRETFQRVKYNADNDTWLVSDTTGVKSTYRAQSLGSPKTHRWALATVEDTHGNTVRYGYWCDETRECYLETIAYAGGGDAERPGVEVRFFYEARSSADRLSYATGGSVAEVRYRLKTVAVFMVEELVRAYALSYSPSLNSSRSLLQKVEQFGRKAELDEKGALSGDALPARTFSMTPPRGGWTAGLDSEQAFSLATVQRPAPVFDRFATGPEEQLFGVGEYPTPALTFSGDVSGDGLDDWLSIRFMVFDEPDQYGRRSKLEVLAIFRDRHRQVRKVTQEIYLAEDRPPYGIWVRDVDGDDRDDLVVDMGWRSNDSHTLFYFASRADGDGIRYEFLSRADPPWTNAQTGIGRAPESPVPCTPGDFDGDRNADLACLYIDRNSGALQIGAVLSLQPTPTAWPIAVDSPTSMLNRPATEKFASTRLAAGDVNGDGLADLITVSRKYYCESVGCSGTSTSEINLALSNGDGTFSTGGAATDWPVGGDWYVADLDSNGRSDVIQIAGSVIRSALVQPGSGTSFAFQSQPLAPLPSGSFVSFGDTDGDARADLIVVSPQPAQPEQPLCSPAVPFAHPVVRRASSQGDGTFLFGSDWDGCGAEHHDIRWHGRGGYGSPLQTAWGAVENAGATDVNGDGLADARLTYVHVDTYGVGGKWSRRYVLDDPSTARGLDRFNFTPADVNNDGLPDLVYLQHLNPGVRVHTLLRKLGGGFESKAQNILPSAAVPGLDNPDMRRWLAIDVGSPGSGEVDGKADLVAVDRTPDNLRVYTFLSKGDGSWAAVADTVAVSAAGGPSSERWRAADVTGDARLDLIRPNAPDIAPYVLVSAGTGAWRPVGGASQQSLQSWLVYPSGNALSVDANGDGAADLVSFHPGKIRTRMSNRDGSWATKVEQPLGLPLAGLVNAKAAELNGDGAGDIVHVGHDGIDLVVTAFVSRGDGSWTVERTRPADFRLFLDTDASNWRPIDVNKDQRSDLVHISTYMDAGKRKTRVTVALNQGGEWKKIVTSDLAPSFTEPWKWHTMDTDGDGSGLAYVSHRGSYHSQSGVLVWSLEPQGGERLEREQNGLGASTSIAYTTSAGRHARMPSGTLVETVESVTVAAGDTTTKTTYVHDGAVWSDSQRRLLGFGRVTASDPRTRTTADYELSDACGARPTREALGPPDGGTITATNWSYVNDTPDRGVWRCLPETQDRFECELTAECRNASTHYSYDDYGNVTELLETGDVDDRDDDRRTETTFNPNTSAYLVSLPATVNVYGRDPDSDWRLASSTRYVYDDAHSHESTPGEAGGLRRLERWDDQADRFLATEYSYDAVGNVTRMDGPRAATEEKTSEGLADSMWTTFEYDDQFALFVAKTCNAKFCVSQEWDTQLGVVSSQTDANGQLTQFAHDSFGRPTRTTRPDGSFSSREYLDWGDPDSQRIRTETSDGSAGDGVLWAEEHLDGLGRTRRVVREGAIVAAATYVGSSSLVAATAAPHRAERGESAQWTSYWYDAAGRNVAVAHPDGSEASTEYGVGRRTLTDEVRRSRTITTDAYGRAVKVVQHGQPPELIEEGSGEIQATYRYDVLGRLTTVIDDAGNTTTADWDSLGRRTQLCDPDRGCSTWTHYSNDQVATQTDAKGQQIRFVYDEIGRQLRKEYLASGNVVRTASWTYDEGEFGVGRLTSSQDSGSQSSERYTYDSVGRTATERRCVDVVCVEIGYGYDRAGRLGALTYPNASGTVSPHSETVTYGYGDDGMLTSVSNYLTQIEHDAGGRIKSMQGQGVRSTFSYDPHRFWLTGASVHALAGPLLYNATYDHEPDGQVVSMSIANGSSVSSRLIYDDIGRLKHVDSSDPARSRNYRYDHLGNITHNSAVGDYVYSDPNHVHAVTSAGGRPYSYDANGNLTGDDTRTLEWDHENRLTLAHTVETPPEDGGKQALEPIEVVTEFGYNAAGERVRKTVSLPDPAASLPESKEPEQPSTTRSFGPLVEIDAEGQLVKHYYAEGMHIATADATGVHAYHHDHVGSTRLVTSSTGAVEARFDYDAFGAPVDTPAGSRSFGFAGHREEGELGLVDMRARYYDPTLGRFISADSIVPDPLDPQSLNRYSYVRNDPFSRIDPSGHEDVGISQRYERGGSAVGFGLGILLGWITDKMNTWLSGGGQARPVAASPRPPKPPTGKWVNVDLAPSPDQGSDPSEWAQWPSAPPLVPAEDPDPYSQFIAGLFKLWLSNAGGAQDVGSAQDPADEIGLMVRVDKKRAAAVQTAHEELRRKLSNPLMFMPMLGPGQDMWLRSQAFRYVTVGKGGAQLIYKLPGPDVGWIGLSFESYMTGDDFNDWIGPFYRLHKAMDHAPEQAQREMAAERDAARAITTQRELQRVLNSLGLYLPWQVPPKD